MTLHLLFLISVLLSQTSTPQQVADQLLAEDRAFAQLAASKANVIDALTPMFVDDVIMPMPGGKFAHSVGEVVAFLKTNPDNTTAKAEWTPIRAGISADATQGFTFGYMTLRKPDGTTIPLKYMAYWVKSGAGWRVQAYKRARRPEGAVSSDMMPASLPAAMVTPDRSRLAAAESSLAAAEKAFSDEAQKIGLGAAFTKYGAADAVNMGPEAGYVVGNAKIGAGMGPGTTSSVRWAADEKVIAASSGDLGISIGLIRRNAPLPDGTMPPPNAFFTIWRKVNGVWKYVAE